MQILYFFAVGCSTCLVQRGILNRLGEEYSIKIICINADSDFDFINKFAPSGIPELVFLVNNKEVDRLKGVQHKEEIEKVIRKFIN